MHLTSGYIFPFGSISSLFNIERKMQPCEKPSFGVMIHMVWLGMQLGQYLLKRTSNTEHENCLSTHESCHTDIQSGRGIVLHCLNLESHTWVINLILCFTPGARPSSDHLFIKTHSCSTVTLHTDNRQCGETGRVPKYHCQTCWYYQCLLKYIFQNVLRPSSYWLWTKIISE